MRSARVLLVVAMLFAARAGAFERSDYFIDLAPVNVDSLLEQAPAATALAEHDYFYVLDKSDFSLNSDYTFTETYHCLRTITSSEGTRLVGSRVISYKEGYDSVFINVARSISPDGTVHPVPDDQIMFDITPSNLVDNDLYTDQRQIRINFAGLEVGSVIEIMYTRKRFKTDIPGFSMYFSFNTAVPSMIGSVSIRFPQSLNLLAKTYRTAAAPNVDTSDELITKTWRLYNLDPLPNEPGSVPLVDITARADFTTYSSWQDFGKVIYDSLWASDLSAPLEESEVALLESLQLDGLTPLEKVKKIYYFLQENVRYLGLEVGIDNIKPHKSSLISEKRYGDCKDQVNLLIKLLRQEGIEAKPALVATNTLTIDSAFACYSFIKHALAYLPGVGGRSYWLDPTSQFAPVGWVSPNINNTIAVVLDGMGGTLIGIPPNEPTVDLMGRSSTAKLDTSGTAIIELATTYYGWIGVNLKSRLKYLNEDELDNYVKSRILANNPAVHDVSYSLEGLDDYDSPAVIKISYVDDRFAEKLGDLLIRKQPLTGYSGMFDKSGRLEHRETDLYLGYTPSFRWEAVLCYPEGYRIKERPSAAAIDSEFFEFTRKIVDTVDNELKSELYLKVRTPYIPVAKYQEYRARLNEMDATAGQSLVLERID